MRQSATLQLTDFYRLIMECDVGRFLILRQYSILNTRRKVHAKCSTARDMPSHLFELHSAPFRPVDKCQGGKSQSRYLFTPRGRIRVAPRQILSLSKNPPLANCRTLRLVTVNVACFIAGLREERADRRPSPPDAVRVYGT